MTLQDVADFINNNRVTSRYQQPAVGLDSHPIPVFLATVKGKKLGFVNPQETTVAPSVATVHEVFEHGDGFSVRVDEPWFEQSITFEHISKDNEILNAIWRNTLDAISENDDEVHQMLDTALNDTVNDTFDEGQLKNFDYVRWSGFDVELGEQVPMGVIVVGEENRLAARAFPGYHQDATQFGGAAVSLDQAGAIADQLSIISAPMSIRASSWEDAAVRAQYDYAKDYYAETGRSVYA
jgi:hypothetical protein